MTATRTFPDPVMIAPTRDENGAPIFSVLTKRTYSVAEGALERVEGPPLLEADVYYGNGDPETCSLKYEAETAPYKTRTDVVVVGDAVSRDLEPVQMMDVGVRVGEHWKALRVTGDRRCVYRPDHLPTFTEPAPFTRMPIRYERAYGGVDRESEPDIDFFYPRNHVGTGVVLRNTREAIEGLALPNIEDPEDLLTPERVVLEDPDRWNDQPFAQGFGWFHKAWYPRCSYLGVIPGTMDPDTVMREASLGLVPERQIALARQHKLPAFDIRFNNGASLGLAVPFLRGDEPVTLAGLTAEGRLDFPLPGDTPSIALDIGAGPVELDPALHTLCIRMEEMEVDLVWRGSLEYPGVKALADLARLDARVA